MLVRVQSCADFTIEFEAFCFELFMFISRSVLLLQGMVRPESGLTNSCYDGLAVRKALFGATGRGRFYRPRTAFSQKSARGTDRMIPRAR